MAARDWMGRLLRLGLIWGVLGGPGAAQVPGPPPVPATPPDPRWRLVWQDDFSGPAGSAPDERFWDYDLGNARTGGWGNRELQFYTRSPDNVRMDGQGHLEIRALRSAADLPCWDGDPCRYTSARLVTRGRVTFTSGRLEARIRVPAGVGLWPAFWSLGVGGSWPYAGEIDVMEWLGREPLTVYGTVHGPGYSGAAGVSGHVDRARPLSDDFHTYTVIKRPNEIVWQLDGQTYHRVTPADLPEGASWVFERPFSLLLNLAVGGTWPGPPDATTPFPAVMSVDYVRLWEERPGP